jgi:predicted phosphoribosyltransferase
MGPRFQDRFDAGRFVARKLARPPKEKELVVLALPRGGVPIGYEIARALQAPLDVFVVRKLGVPGYEELAMGAIASGGVRVLNEEAIERLGIPHNVIETIARNEELELSRREHAYRGDREPVPIANRHVVLVDDGLATGASMRAAVLALRQKKPATVTVAVPIGSKETCDQFREEVDEVVCGETPEPFFSVGAWYSNFLQITDDEVRELLDRAAHERRLERVEANRASASRPGSQHVGRS